MKSFISNKVICWLSLHVSTDSFEGEIWMLRARLVTFEPSPLSDWRWMPLSSSSLNSQVNPLAFTLALAVRVGPFGYTQATTTRSQRAQAGAGRRCSRVVAVSARPPMKPTLIPLNTYETGRAPWPPEQHVPARWDQSCSICPWVYLLHRRSPRPVAVGAAAEVEPVSRGGPRAAPCSGRTATTFHKEEITHRWAGSV